MNESESKPEFTWQLQIKDDKEETNLDEEDDYCIEFFHTGSTNLADDVAAMGLSPSTAIWIVRNDFPRSFPASGIFHHVWKEPDYDKIIVVGLLLKRSCVEAAKEKRVGQDDNKKYISDGYGSYGIADAVHEAELSSAKINVWFEDKSEMKSIEQIKSLLQAQRKSTSSKFVFSDSKQALEDDNAELWQKMIESNRTQGLAKRLLQLELVGRNEFLTAILHYTVQVTTDALKEYLESHDQNGSSSPFLFDWLPLLKEFLESLQRLDELSKKQQPNTESSGDESDSGGDCWEVNLVFPKEEANDPSYKNLLQNTELETSLQQMNDSLKSVLQLLEVNKEVRVNWRFLYEDVALPKYRFEIVNNDYSVLGDEQSLFLNPKVTEASVTINSIELVARLESSDFQDNPIEKVRLKIRDTSDTAIQRTVDYDFTPDGTSLLLTDLNVDTQYSIKWCTVYKFGNGLWQSMETIRTKACVPPDIVNVTVESPVSLQISLKLYDQPNAVNVNEIIIRVTDTDTNQESDHRLSKSDQVSVKIRGRGTYSVQAAAVTDDSKQSIWSRKIISKVEFSDNEILKHSICESAIKISDDKSPVVYELQMDQTYNDERSQIRKMELGKQSQCDAKLEKVIMIVGETGCGKTTLINSMVNYIYGVKYEDSFRFKILTDSNEKSLQHSQAKSQTQWVTSYTFHHATGCQQDCTFTLIDTPGFGDTGGIVNDQKIVDRIRAFFSCNEGIDHIDAVGFVVKASSSRLTQTELYVFDSILSLFGKDVGDNIFILVTFADGQTPPVVHTLQEARIPYKSMIKFNNSAVFSSKDDSDSMTAMFNKMFWKMGMKSFEEFFIDLMQIHPKSLTLTRDVLNERENLQLQVVAIKQRIDEGLCKLNQLETEIGVIKNHKKDIERNKEFTYTVKQDKIIKEDIPKGTYVTNCLECNRTCHYPCAYSNDEDKKKCCAMNNDNCTVCKSRCHWSLHHNMPYRLLVKVEEVTKTSKDLKRRYLDAEGNMRSAKEIAQKIYEDYLLSRAKVLELVKESKRSLEKLHEIALKPNPLSEVDYIDKLISAEESNKKEGFKTRIEQLRGIRELACRMSEMRTGDILKDLIAKEERISKKYKDFVDNDKAAKNLFGRLGDFVAKKFFGPKEH